jgi:hypothetical protein
MKSIILLLVLVSLGFSKMDTVKTKTLLSVSPRGSDACESDVLEEEDSGRGTFGEDEHKCDDE